MAEAASPMQIKSLDGTVQATADVSTEPLQSQSKNGLPAGQKVNASLPSESQQPPPGQALTGKQEHCMWCQRSRKQRTCL